MIRRLIWLACLLLFVPIVGDAGTATTNLTVNIQTGIPCDIGTPYLGSIPAGAAAAGFNHCAAHYDFTSSNNFTYNSQTYNFSNPATWMDVCMSNPSGSLWVTEQSDGQGSRAGCNAFSITSDGSVPKVLQMHWEPSYLNSSILTTGMHTSNGQPYQNYGNVQDFPMGAYWQAIFRNTVGSFSNPANGGSPFTADWWSWQAGYPEIEIDWLETYAYDASTGNPMCGAVRCHSVSGGRNYTLNTYYNMSTYASPGNLYDSFDPTVYQVYGSRVTNNGTQIDVCSYLNNTFVSCGGAWNYDSSQAGNRSYAIMYDGPQNNDGYNPGVAQDLYVKDIAIFTCANWQTGNNCTGSLLDGAP